MLIIISLIAASLLAIGYLRATIEVSKPEFILNADVVLKSWISDNKWMTYFTPFFSLFLFLIILLSWILYGLVSVVDFIAFILKKLWSGLLWIWYEVFHPTLFSIMQLVWHYVFILGFKFFKNSLDKISGSINYNNYVISFKKLILPVLLSTIAIIIYILTQNIIVQVIAYLIIFYLFQYSVFISISSFRSASFNKTMVMTGIRLSVIWLGFASVATAMMVMLKQYSYIYIVSSLSITLIQILLPVIILFGIAFILSTLYLPAYMAESKSDFTIIGFWKSIFLRIPKLIISQPFQLIGLGVISIIPVLFIFLLSFTVEKVSGDNLFTNAKNSILFDYHIPSVKGNIIKIEKIQKDIVSLKILEDSISKDFDVRITNLREELKEAIRLKDDIKNDVIHTFNRSAFIGEYQSFSYPDISGCSQVVWKIEKATNKVTVKTQRFSGVTGTSVFYHQWKIPGIYTISLIRPSSCANGYTPSIQVEVIEANDSTDIPETRYFVTREAAGYAIDLLNKQLLDVQTAKQLSLKKISGNHQIYTDTIEHLKFQSKEHWHMFISKILTIFGLMLLFLLLISSIWTYFVTYHFDMYNFEQDGKYYVVSLFEKIKNQNSNQPYLGFFIILLTTVFMYFLLQVNVINEWIVSLIGL